MIELSQKQINQLSKYISIVDIKSYIETHLLEYEQFLKEEQHKEEQ